MFRKFVLSFLLILTNHSYSQWFQKPSGVTADLNSVFFLNTGYGFIVGNSGTFIKTTNGGMNWSSATLIADDLNDVCFINENEGTIVGIEGSILRTTDGGTTWNTVASGVTDNLYSVSFNGLNGIIGGSSQTILYSTNGGASWNISQKGFFGGGFFGAFMLSSTVGFIAGQNSIFQPLFGKSTDGGVTWDFHSFYFNGNEGWCNDIYFFDENTGLVTGSVWDGQGAISRTTNSGTDWSTSFFSNPIVGVDFTTVDIGFAVGYAGTILTTTNSGLSWPQQTSGTSNNLAEVDFFGDAVNGVAVGEGGLILGTNNGGVPVELTSFTAKLNGNKVSLNWSTASETNNLGFEVEKKTNDDWITIGFVEGHGTTTQSQSYFFVDDLSEVSSVVISYRLKQVDFNGAFEHSKSIEVNFNSVPQEFSLYQNYPNPFNPASTIQYSVPNEELITIKVYDATGSEVMTLVNEVKHPGNYEILFDGSVLSSGVYFYEMRAGSFSEVKQFMLLK